MQKVRVGSWYTFRHAMIDWQFRDHDGERVQVRNMHGAPPANTMGHCYIFSEAGKFIGLVSCGSLSKTGKE